MSKPEYGRAADNPSVVWHIRRGGWWGTAVCGVYLSPTGPSEVPFHRICHNCQRIVKAQENMPDTTEGLTDPQMNVLKRMYARVGVVRPKEVGVHEATLLALERRGFVEQYLNASYCKYFRLTIRGINLVRNL